MPHNQAEMQDLPDEICANSLQEHDCLEVSACSTKVALSVGAVLEANEKVWHETHNLQLQRLNISPLLSLLSSLNSGVKHLH